MVNRREFLGVTLGAGATLALTPTLLRALQALQQPGGTLMQRAVPSSGEMLPVVGLHLQNNTSQDPAVRKEILKTLVDNGGRFFDTVLQSQPGVEDLLAQAVTELGIQNKLFLGLRGAPPGPQQADPAGAAKGQIDALLAKFRVPKLDLVQLGSSGHPSMFAVLKEAKQEGRVRHIGATAIVPSRYPLLEALIRSDSVDFISIDYSVDRRRAEETLLPLAQERKIGVAAYFPFGINSGSLFRRVGTKPLPEWAAEFDAKTWAQFFIKYVVSHPAVTVVCTSTSKATHMLDNIGGGIGRLPDAATRRRMAALVDTWPQPGPR